MKLPTKEQLCRTKSFIYDPSTDKLYLLSENDEVISENTEMWKPGRLIGIQERVAVIQFLMDTFVPLALDGPIVFNFEPANPIGSYVWRRIASE